MNAVSHTCPHRSDRRIYNHDIMSCTHEDVAGNHLYSGRALGLTDPEDVIQIHPFLKGEWQAISAHYGRIGLPHSRNVVWDVSLDRLAEYPDLGESVFFFGRRENRVRAHQGWYQVVDHINDKNNFMALASHLGLNAPKTRCYQGKEWFAGLEHFEYPCFVKAAVSVAGKGIFRCETPEDVVLALAHFDEGVPLQVQNEIKTDVFLNLQYQADDHGVERLLASEQLLKGFSHQGNRYPACHEPWHSVDPMAEWLWEKGIRGIFAFDVGVLKGEDGPRFIPIECNPRFNGASYPSGVACRLGIPEWVAREIPTRCGSLSGVDLEGLEYNRETGAGIVLVNWGTILAGKIGVLFAGNRQEQVALEEELRSRL